MISQHQLHPQESTAETTFGEFWHMRIKELVNFYCCTKESALTDCVKNSLEHRTTTTSWHFYRSLQKGTPKTSLRTSCSCSNLAPSIWKTLQEHKSHTTGLSSSFFPQLMQPYALTIVVVQYVTLSRILYIVHRMYACKYMAHIFVLRLPSCPRLMFSSC